MDLTPLHLRSIGYEKQLGYGAFCDRVFGHITQCIQMA
jgi:hypothetical protein